MRSGKGDRILSHIRSRVQSLKRWIPRVHLERQPSSKKESDARSNQSRLTAFESEDSDLDSVSPDDPPQNEPDKDRHTGIIYARVSTQKQVTDGTSLESQIAILREIADNEGISLECEPIRDKGETGTSFDRDGIQEVFQQAQKEAVSYLLVQDISRIGRAAAETLYFIYLLQTECDVTLVTPSGEQDISSTQGLLRTHLMSLMGQLMNEMRLRKANESVIRSFIDEKDWRAYNPIIPLGYSATEDGWIEKDPELAPVVQETFHEFIDCENYAETKRRIENEYGPVFDGHRIKTCLQEHAYIGRPQVSAEAASDYHGTRVIDDPALQMIEEETFDEVQAIIERKNEIHAMNDDTEEIVDFIEEFDLFGVVESSPAVTLRCENCGSNEMVKNGQRDLTGTSLSAYMYRCKECSTTRKWPRDSEYSHMKLLQEIPQLRGLREQLTNN
ncbi:recombinase family protein [Halocatena salina]|uniref:Recombinase family protein n=1 Tax=Halocatena salina TaxID=2934340 RepID=A0A8U0A269_9EURY|nr:recombinase family protein [Halocatena salina]UPM43162.1 recombinase family protein [Halocatena salina]